ncbi:Serine protease htra2, mitochondrial [Gaertneriomyces sp. JEL0708]|nr:Serine protease htra2, mitochondrial [Gaertneriomyces sp. JEL0708]
MPTIWRAALRPQAVLPLHSKLSRVAHRARGLRSRPQPLRLPGVRRRQPSEQALLINQARPSSPGQRSTFTYIVFVVLVALGVSPLLTSPIHTWGAWKEPFPVKVVKNVQEVGVDDVLGQSEQSIQPKTKRWAAKSEKDGKCVCAGGIADAVEKCLTGVVGISVETDASTLLTRRSLMSSGSGFFISEDGLILTNAHVVTDMSEGSKLTVTTSDGSQYEGYIHSLDMPSDLAVVKIKSGGGRKWDVLAMSSNLHLRPGDWCVSIGSPFGLQNTVTAGIISSTHRSPLQLPESSSSDVRVEFIQTDCVIHEGSSGGPLINLNGEVIGICTQRAESEGISFAIRVDSAEALVRQLCDKGRVVRPWLGCRMVTLTPSTLKQFISSHPLTPLPGSSGVLITTVFPSSPFSVAGILEGDVIASINGESVTSSQEVFKLVGLVDGSTGEGTVTVGLKRCVPLDIDWDGRSTRWEVQEAEVEVKVGEWDEEVHVNTRAL